MAAAVVKRLGSPPPDAMKVAIEIGVLAVLGDDDRGGALQRLVKEVAVVAEVGGVVAARR